MPDRRDPLNEAIAQFWQRRVSARKRGSGGDRGQRSAVTFGGQLDAIVELIEERVRQSIGSEEIEFRKARRAPVLPGYFRPEKEWDLVILVGAELGAAIELKSHVGPSFGNNFNNRAEEALGSAEDLWTAYRNGAFGMQAAPWVGYLLLLEDHEMSRRQVGVSEPIFDVFDEFKNASYALRYELLLRRMMRERRYTATCLIMSTDPTNGEWRVTDPGDDISYERWMRSLTAHLQGMAE